MFDVRIDTFIAVCEHMNYTKAAEELHITQPAVSQHIHYLENYYKTKLFDYKGRKLFLTDNGKKLLKISTTFKNDEDFFKKYVLHDSDETRPMRFGLTKTIGEILTTKQVAGLVKKYPKRDMNIVIANTQELLSEVRKGSIHFALIEGYYDTNEFDHMKYSDERIVGICAANHKFTKEPHQMKDLLGETLIIRENGSGTRNILKRNLDLNGIEIQDFNRRIQLNNMHAIVDMVTEDCGITFIYEAAVAEYIKQGLIKKIKLEDFDIHHEFTFIWNKESVFKDFYLGICKDLMIDQKH